MGKKSFSGIIVLIPLIFSGVPGICFISDLCSKSSFYQSVFMKRLVCLAFLWPVLAAWQPLRASEGPGIPYTNSKQAGVYTVTLAGNGYIYPNGKLSGTGEVGENGLTGWMNAKAYTRTYFLLEKGGQLNVALLLRSASGGGKLKVSLDGKNAREVSFKQDGDFEKTDIGSFTVDKPGYHYVEIRGVSKTGAAFPDIRTVELSGPAQEGARANNSQWKSAPATHLSYPMPKDTVAEWFYNEISVPANAQPLHAYYMVNGFNGGYFGIQINSPTERRVLFSIWSAFTTDNPKDIPDEFRVKLLNRGDNVTVNDFGNEGSGGQSYWRFNWKAETVYKLLVRAKVQGDHTIFTGYFFDPAVGKWKLIAQWDKPKDGKYLKGLYSFVENFGDNGQDFFKARYNNQWICTPSGKWIELTQARFSTTADPNKHPRFDIGAGLEGKWFQMFSGGFRAVGTTKKGDIISRPAGNTKPPVNLAQFAE